jgi:hypothetical protein
MLLGLIVVSVNPKFIRGNDGGVEVGFVSGLFLKLRADGIAVLLLVTAQQPGYKFSSNELHAELMLQNH